MKIYLASDHGGYQLKEQVKEFLSQELVVVDLGARQLEPDDDYPVFALRLAEAVVASQQTEPTYGFLFCRSGSGMVIAANKVLGARAVDIYSPDLAQHAVSHNHANIFAFGADFVDQQLVLEAIASILETQPSQAVRHLRRLAEISRYESNRKLD